MDNVAQLETDTNFQSRKKITWGVFSVLMLFLFAGILYYFFVYRFYQSTDNAYVQADVTWVMPKISGEVMELLINDNQVVKKGETLAVLDHRDYQARYDQARSVVSLKEAALGVQQQNEKSARSSITEAHSGVVAAQADLTRLGFVGPYLMGYLKTATGSFTSGFMIMGCILFLAAFMTALLHIAMKKRELPQ